MSLFEFSSEDEKPARFAARLPILTRDETVFGYKLLFRTGIGNYLHQADGDAASRGVIDMSSLIGLPILSNNLPAFIVTTRDILLGNYLALLPADKVIAEIPDTVAMDDQVLRACQKLKESGCGIALNGFRATDSREPLAPIADFVKIDMKGPSVAEISALTQRFHTRGPRLIAEKVETRDDFEFAKSEGFSYFEGYFFRKPEMMRARGAQSYRTVYLRLLTAISKPALDWREIEDIVKSDPMLYYRLLRYINSPLFGLRGEVKNIGQALTILGEDEIRRWCRLSGMLELSRHRPSDLALASLVRANFAEAIADRLQYRDSDLFQVGLLSLMDAILEIHMREVIEGLPLDDDAKIVLLENKGPLAPIYELMLAMEAGIWPKIEALASALGIEQEYIAKAYWDAMDWAQSIVTAAAAA
jgi:EAL and modified HD-GYP domain-containing signal transduction protein